MAIKRSQMREMTEGAFADSQPEPSPSAMVGPNSAHEKVMEEIRGIKKPDNDVLEKETKKKDVDTEKTAEDIAALHLTLAGLVEKQDAMMKSQEEMLKTLSTMGSELLIVKSKVNEEGKQVPPPAATDESPSEKGLPGTSVSSSVPTSLGKTQRTHMKFLKAHLLQRAMGILCDQKTGELYLGRSMPNRKFGSLRGGRLFLLSIFRNFMLGSGHSLQSDLSSSFTEKDMRDWLTEEITMLTGFAPTFDFTDKGLMVYLNIKLE